MVRIESSHKWVKWQLPFMAAAKGMDSVLDADHPSSMSSLEPLFHGQSHPYPVSDEGYLRP